jgi:hypothetical protein
MMDSAPRTVPLSSRWTRSSPFRSSTASQRLPLCWVRTFPTLLSLPSQHRIGPPFRSSACGNPLRISSRPLRSRAVLNSFACVRSSALLLLLRTRFYAQRWRTQNQKRRMPLGESFGISPCVGWGRSGLIAEMRPGLLVSGRHSLPLVLVLIYRLWRSYRSWLAVAGSFRLTHRGTTSALVLPTRVPRRRTTGLLISLLTSFAQHTK